MMSTGIVRRLDQLGRVVIPKEVREKLMIEPGDDLEVLLGDDVIGFKKFVSSSTCVVTGTVSPNNYKLPSGMVVSEEGARQLEREIRKAFGK